ncbi:MAG: hypothetical protein IJD38_00825 [Clostridia bacterium]|nr:hypothetical protein [Clostridia bacterium]
MKPDNPILNGWLYKKIEAAERLDEITPFTTGRVQRTLLIGYSQAAQIADLFIQLEIVSIRDEDGHRHALVSPREAAIRVIRYLCRELEDTEEEPTIPSFSYEDDTPDERDAPKAIPACDEEDWFGDVLSDVPVRLLSRKELLYQAVKVICSYECVGTTLLQRHLCIGYGRASDLINTLEELGIVSPDPGSRQGRNILLAREEALARIEALPDGED